MNIMELGAIGEFVGAVAVVGSLIYVGLQVRQNTAATRAASHHAFTDSANELNLLIAQDSAFTSLWVKWRENRSQLTESERLQGDCMALATFRLLETLFYQSEVGAGERKLLQSEERSIEYMLSMASFRDWWSDNPFSLGSDFRTYAESFFPKAELERKGA